MKIFKLVRHSVNILLSLLACFISILMCDAFWDWPDRVGLETYNGDAYTGIQNAAAKTANNLECLINNLESCLPYIAVISCIIFLMFILKNIEAIISFVKEIRKEQKLRREKEMELLRQQYQSSGVYYAPPKQQ